MLKRPIQALTLACILALCASANALPSHAEPACPVDIPNDRTTTVRCSYSVKTSSPGKTTRPKHTKKTTRTKHTLTLTPHQQQTQQATNQALIALCTATRITNQPCTTPTKPTNNKTDPTTTAHEIIAQLHITSPTPTIGPKPALDRWKFIPVGYPVWLTANHPNQPTNTTTTKNGHTITITLAKPTYHWNMGDGTTITCTTMTTWHPRTDQRILPSPDCGHTYKKKGKYHITLTTTWPTTWTTPNNTGTLTIQTTQKTTLPIGELHALING